MLSATCVDTAVEHTAAVLDSHQAARYVTAPVCKSQDDHTTDPGLGGQSRNVRSAADRRSQHSPLGCF